MLKHFNSGHPVVVLDSAWYYAQLAIIFQAPQINASDQDLFEITYQISDRIDHPTRAPVLSLDISRLTCLESILSNEQIERKARDAAQLYAERLHREVASIGMIDYGLYDQYLFNYQLYTIQNGRIVYRKINDTPNVGL